MVEQQDAWKFQKTLKAVVVGFDICLEVGICSDSEVQVLVYILFVLYNRQFLYSLKKFSSSL